MDDNTLHAHAWLHDCDVLIESLQRLEEGGGRFLSAPLEIRLVATREILWAKTHLAKAAQRLRIYAPELPPPNQPKETDHV